MLNWITATLSTVVVLGTASSCGIAKASNTSTNLSLNCSAHFWASHQVIDFSVETGEAVRKGLV